MFPKQCSHCRGSGGDSGTGRLVCGQFGRLGRPTFMRRRGTWWMLPRSRADEKLGRATFCRKTQWFQHTFPLSSDSVPAGLRGILGGSGVPLDVPSGLSGVSRIPPAGTSRIPPLRFLLKESFLRIPLPGFLQDSTSRIPP